jgi:hypothetical protein
MKENTMNKFDTCKNFQGLDHDEVAPSYHDHNAARAKAHFEGTPEQGSIIPPIPPLVVGSIVQLDNLPCDTEGGEAVLASISFPGGTGQTLSEMMEHSGHPTSRDRIRENGPQGPEQEASPQDIIDCYLSGQMTETCWQEHLNNLAVCDAWSDWLIQNTPKSSINECNLGYQPHLAHCEAIYPDAEEFHGEPEYPDENWEDVLEGMDALVERYRDERDMEAEAQWFETLNDIPETPPAGNARAFPLPNDKQARKDAPVCGGVLDYFKNALFEVARVSKQGNDQHNPGQPLHWSRDKSTDHADCIMRHLSERGTIDDDGMRHSAKLAWRALALLQSELEEEYYKARPEK